MLRHQLTRSGLLLGLVGVALTTACTTPGVGNRPAEVTDLRGSMEALEALQPADIAIAPIRNQTGKEVPVEEFRSAFADELIERLYSPLGFDYVDANWIESSFRGTPAPDALLVVALTEWNPTHLYSTGIVAAAGELFLFEGGSTTGSPLWGLTLRRKLDLSDGHGNPPSPSEHWIGFAIRRFAREALGELPERDPLAAHQASAAP